MIQCSIIFDVALGFALHVYIYKIRLFFVSVLRIKFKAFYCSTFWCDLMFSFSLLFAKPHRHYQLHRVGCCCCVGCFMREMRIEIADWFANASVCHVPRCKYCMHV